MQDRESAKNLKALGKKTVYEYSYDKSLLEAFDNRCQNEQVIKLTASEFTSLCPITGQPDYGTIIINYIPNLKVVESKSLKLYLFSFRNFGSFHESVVDTILKDLIELLDPLYIEVLGCFNSRGGISIHPFSNYAKNNTKYVSWVEKRKMEQANSNL
jgi:7-cyano-7-deazaguanine reductase